MKTSQQVFKRIAGDKKGKITVTKTDLYKIRDKINDFRMRGDSGGMMYVNALEQELRASRVVEAEQIDPDVITMNSKVKIKDQKTGEESVYDLVYPQDADIDQNRISVLSPLGSSLLGYRVQDVIELKVPAGTRQYRIEELLYQPEAAGDFHL